MLCFISWLTWADKRLKKWFELCKQLAAFDGRDNARAQVQTRNNAKTTKKNLKIVIF